MKPFSEYFYESISRDAQAANVFSAFGKPKKQQGFPFKENFRNLPSCSTMFLTWETPKIEVKVVQKQIEKMILGGTWKKVRGKNPEYCMHFYEQGYVKAFIFEDEGESPVQVVNPRSTLPYIIGFEME